MDPTFVSPFKNCYPCRPSFIPGGICRDCRPGFFVRSSSDIHQVYGCSSGPAEAPGHPNPQLPRQLAYFSQLQGAGDSSQGLSPSPTSRAWPPAEWPEERAHPSPADHFWRVCLDSTSMQVHLAPARVESIQSCTARFKLGWHVSVCLCSRVLGLMVAAPLVLPLGLLHMRPFLWWMKSLGIRLSWPSLHLLKVSDACFCTLLVWRDPSFLSSGVRTGVICRRQMITTDASLLGWGAVFEG